MVNPAAPQLFSVSKPFVRSRSRPGLPRTITIKGLGFGATKGTGNGHLGSVDTVTTSSWSDTQIVATVPAVGLRPASCRRARTP